MAQCIMVALVQVAVIWLAIDFVAPIEQCISLDGFVGRCIKLSKCESLSDIWQSPVRSIQQSERLADSLCGRYKINPLVCCLEVHKACSYGSNFGFAKPSPKPTSTPRVSTRRTRTSTSPPRRPYPTRVATSTSRSSTRRTFRTSTSTTRKSSRKPKTTTTTTFKPNVPIFNDKVTVQQTTLDEFPWSALIQYRKSAGVFGFHCGATLIHERYVVTAAHCVKAVPRSWEISSIRLGDYNTSNDGVDCVSDQCADPYVDVRVEQIVVHEDYVTRRISQYNDIALLRLADFIEPTSFIRPILLPFEGIEKVLFHQQKTVVSAGWGRTKTGSASTVKMKVKLNLEDLNFCAASYKVAGVKLRDSQLCASEWRGTGVCSCDSGGPLMVQLSGQYYLVGIVSFGPAKCGLKNAPGVYTSVVKYGSWIRRNIY